MDEDNSLENDTLYEGDFIFDDYDQHIVIATAFLAASLIGIVGNSLVIFSVFASNKLRTITNAFVVNLSVADLLTCLLMPWNAVILLSHKEHPIADIGCAVIAGLLFTCVGCSLFTLASIAITRLMLITRPISTSRVIFSPVYTGTWIAATWGLSFIFNVIPPLAGVGRLGTSQKYRVCATKSTHELKDIYDFIQGGGCFPIPLITLVVCYVLIYKHLKRHSRTLLGHEVPMPSHGGDTMVSSSDGGGTLQLQDSDQMTGRQDHHQSRRDTTASSTLTRLRLRDRQNRVTKNMFIIFIAFVICITPITITLFLSDGSPLKAITPYATALVLVNACINPILYGFKHPNFKVVFKSLLTCRYYDVPEPSSQFKQWRQCFTMCTRK